MQSPQQNKRHTVVIAQILFAMLMSSSLDVCVCVSVWHVTCDSCV